MSYRDDQAALEARRADLQLELEAIRAKARDAADAVSREAAVERELGDVELRIAARRRPALENLKIATPCTADWGAMKGDDRVRFCDGCQKNVYNLSAMAREEAEAFVEENEGSACVRLYKRADGTVLTTDCPVGVRRQRIRRVAAAAVGAGAMAVAALSLIRLRTRAEPCNPTPMQGEISTETVTTMGTAAPVITATPPATATTPAPVMGAPAVRPPSGPKPGHKVMGRLESRMGDF